MTPLTLLALCASLFFALVLSSEQADSQSDELARLGQLFVKIDKNSDENVSRDELKAWMLSTRRRMNNADTVKQFRINDVDKDGEVTWDEHVEVFWGANKNTSYNKNLLGDDERRFLLADTEGDLKLTSQEFAAFLHPEDNERMIKQMVDQTIGHLDTNGDGVVSLDEYLADLWGGEGERPRWLQAEENEFMKSRDQNSDKMMDHSEVRNWIFPREKDVGAQVDFLITESDADGDGKLTQDEMMLNFALFLGTGEFSNEDNEMKNLRDEL